MSVELEKLERKRLWAIKFLDIDLTELSAKMERGADNEELEAYAYRIEKSSERLMQLFKHKP